MKKFTKIMLILSGVFATIGLTCIITAFGMGLTSNDLWKMVRDGKFTFDQSDLHIGFDVDWNENWDAELSATESQDGEMSIYVIEQLDGSMIKITGQSDIKNKFTDIKLGSHVWIKFAGLTETKNGAMKTYEIDYDDEDLKELENV